MDRNPNLDALAQQSLRFTRPYPESIPSIPARRGIHTGFRSFPFRGWELGNVTKDDVALWGWEPIPEEQTTLSEILLEEGYQTLFVTDTLHQFRASYSFHRGFRVFEWVRGQERDLYVPRTPATDKRIEGTLIGEPNASHAEKIMLQYFANTQNHQSEENYFAPRVFTRASEYLGFAAEGDALFFMTVDCYDPHAPHDPPEKYSRLYSDGFEGPERMEPVYGPADAFTEAQLERMRALYAGEVTMVDRWLGRFLDRIGELHLFEDTMLILLSDHGIAHGEHRVVGKGPAALWPEVTDVPFMIRHPRGTLAGEASDFFASRHDVAQTVLGSLGVEAPAQMTGEDLSVLLDGGQTGTREHFTLGYHDHTWARDERYAMFAKNDRSGAKLYDLERDPGMDRDIAAANGGRVERMWEDYVLGDAGGPLPRY